MILKVGQAFLLLLLFTSGVSASPNIVQSLIVNFPVNGRTIVQAIEEDVKFPQMLLISD
jgi:hypothetical protein